MRLITAFALIAAACSLAHADTMQLVFQDGHEGYAGAQDFMMYAPSSVAFVNYGQSGSLNAGINRWGEHYASILRFDLCDVPAGVKVVAATLHLYHQSEGSPRRELTVDLHALTPANADWVEGDGHGTRVPTPGAPCWRYRKHDTDKWAGAEGARKPGVDFSTEWAAHATAAPETPAWLEFELPASVVQRWLDDPATNAGLHLWPAMAKEKSDVVSFASSEAEEQANRPRLVVTLERTAETVAAVNRARALQMVKSGRERLAEVSASVARFGPPAETVERLAEVEKNLSAIAESVAEAQTLDDALLVQTSAAVAEQVKRLATIPVSAVIDRARQWNRARGLATDFALGIESPMVQVFRRDAPFEGELGDMLRITLARNEHEGAQVVVLPIDVDLQSVTWRLEGPVAAGLTVSAVPVGYVKSVRPQLVTDQAPSEWWPDPLLDFLMTFDVPRTEAQPLWIDVHASADAPAGIHHAQLIVGAQNAESKAIDLEIEVFDFTLPVQQHLKTIWGMNEGNFGRYHGDEYDDDLAWRYFDLFLDHRLAAADLYRTMPTGEKGEDSVYHLGNVEALRRLRERGSGWWNVGYVLAPKHVVGKQRAFGAETYEEYLDKCVAMFKVEVARLKEVGWPQDRMAIYFLDETSNLEALGQAAEAMKAAFPDIPLMTTGYDRSYGQGDSMVAKWMDIWVPLTPRYHEDQAKIIAGRELGKKAWWYICCGPRGRGDLNWFIQYPAIRSRLLMGVAARKYNVDGFLYYRVAGWNNNEEPITTGPYTDWAPHYHETLPDGDGLIICGGPEGPLTTVRLENIRDGIEDYEYYWLLDDLIAQAEAKELGPDARAAVEAAKALQQVPDELLKSVREYADDPAVLAAHRERLARAIEGMSQ